MAINISVKGGGKAKSFLANLRLSMADPPDLLVGFRSGSYSNGMNVPTVAMINEYGATINVSKHEHTIYRKVNAKATGFLRKGKFVRKDKSNFASDHIVPAHTITIPPRPFFRNMITRHQNEWPGDAKTLLIQNNLDIKKTINQMGILIASQLVASIDLLTNPPNAASTIRKKKHSKPLIGITREMRSHVDWWVK